MEVMADNFLVRTDCEVRMHCNNFKLSQVPEMYEQMYVSPLSIKYVTPMKRRAKSPVTPPSVDYAFYDAYRAGSWAGARAHRGLPAVGLELTAAT
jgi:hypothetical protein